MTGWSGWGPDGQGTDHHKRRTARKKLRTALTRFPAWCQAPRHLRRPVLCPRLPAKRRGDDNDSGVYETAARLNAFFHKAMRM
jgi:hypothetical protein